MGRGTSARIEYRQNGNWASGQKHCALKWKVFWFYHLTVIVLVFNEIQGAVVLETELHTRPRKYL